MGCDINEHNQTIIGATAAIDHVYKWALQRNVELGKIWNAWNLHVWKQYDTIIQTTDI